MTQELSNYTVTEDVPRDIVQSPSFPEGEFGQAVYEAYERERTSRFGNNSALRLQFQDDAVVGSTPFDAILINHVLREQGVKGTPRTALPIDLSHPRVLEMTKGKHYADSQSLVLRSAEDSIYSRNNPLAAYLAEHVDMSRVEGEPVLITGLRLEPWTEDEKGYGLRTVPSEEADFHYDDRLSGRWNGYRFDNVDELGLPVSLSRDQGSRKWYTRDDGLSRLFLGGDSDLVSIRSILDYSYSYGRVVVLGGEATAPNSK